MINTSAVVLIFRRNVLHFAEEDQEQKWMNTPMGEQLVQKIYIAKLEFGELFAEPKMSHSYVNVFLCSACFCTEVFVSSFYFSLYFY